MVTLISDALVQQLADQPGEERAFTLAHPEPLRSIEDERDRLRNLDEAGNLSPFSPTGQPVHLPNTSPPTPVQVGECLRGERQITQMDPEL